MQTPSGYVPLGNFVERVATPRVGHINRIAGNRVMTVSANVAAGVQTAKVQQDIAEELAKADLGPGVTWRLKGEDEERAKASAFLLKAFGTAIFLIFAILLAQFNRLTSVFLVLTAVMLSTIGVLLGLLIMGQPFGVVMTGIGVIANAGVIVNNNIVLIDTYDRLRREGREAYDAIIETCRERARPVVLTAVTAILGVLPIAFGMNIEFMTREITVGAPATQWWIQLSTAIVFGLGFATVLTLIVTPAALMLIEQMRAKAHPLHCRRLAARLAKPRRLLDQACRPDDRRPARRFLLDIGLGAVRRVADRLQARVDQDFLERRIRHHLLIGRGDLVDDRLRRRRRREHADEQLADLVGKAGLDGGRNLRCALQPFVREHRENAHLAGLVEFQHLAGDVRRSRRNMAADKIGDGGARALVRNVRQLVEPGRLLELLGREMRHRAGAGRAVRQLARIGLGVVDEFLERLHRQRGVHHPARPTPRTGSRSARSP